HDTLYLPVFPTRRSSDLAVGAEHGVPDGLEEVRGPREEVGRSLLHLRVGRRDEHAAEDEGRDDREQRDEPATLEHLAQDARSGRDRKSTRLNSSHVKISY